MNLPKTMFGIFLNATIMATVVFLYPLLKIDLKIGTIITISAIILEFIVAYLSNNSIILKITDNILNPLTFGMLFAFLLQLTGNLVIPTIAVLIMMTSNYKLTNINYKQLLFVVGNKEKIQFVTEILKNNQIQYKINKQTITFDDNELPGFVLLVAKEDYTKAKEILNLEFWSITHHLITP